MANDLQSFLAENRGKQQELPPVDLRAAIEKTNSKQDNMGVKPYIRNLAGSTLRGMAQVAETPWNIINNAPKLLNLLPGEQGFKKNSEYGAEVGGPVGDFMAWMGEDPLIDAIGSIPRMGGVGGINEPNTNYPISSNIAEAFGSGVTGLGAVGLAAKTPGAAGKFAAALNAPIQAARWAVSWQNRMIWVRLLRL
jgi:hypothetical protein